MIHIRLATESDFPEASALSRLAFAELRKIYTPIPPRPPSKDTQQLTRIIALDADQIVGTLQFELKFDHLHIRALAVHPDHRRRDIARQLIDFVARQAQSRSLPALTLYTIKETGNIPIFEHLGFHNVHEEPDPTAKLFTGLPARDVLMQRPIPTGIQPLTCGGGVY